MKEIILSLLLIALLLPAHQIYAKDTATSQKYVLLLNAYNKGYTWTDNIVLGVEEVLLKHKDIVLKVEYMDTKLNNSQPYYQMLSSLYKTKYANRAFDVVISSDDDALAFLKKYRDTIFPGVPVVFCGVNNFTSANLEGFSLYTGINEVADFQTTLSLIRTLHPNVKTLYVVNDEMTTASHRFPDLL